MRRFFNRIILLIISVFLSVSICSCGLIFKKISCRDIPDSESAANKFISDLRSADRQKHAVKGIGKISIWNSDGVQTFRAAWIGTADGRLRIEILGLPGQPVAKFTFDGEKYTFTSILEQQSFHKSGSGSNMKPITGVRLSTVDLFKYLSGEIPIYDYDQAVFQEGAPDCINTLTLKTKWQGVVERIILGQSRQDVQKVERYHWGALVYAAELGQRKNVDGYLIPFSLIFSDGKGKGFGIQAERCWVNIPVSPGIFSIEPRAPID